MKLIARFRSAALILVSAIILAACSADLTDVEYVQRAKDFQDEGKLQEAGIELKNALRVNGDNIEARWLLGKISLQTGAGAAAEKELARAVQIGLPLEEVYLLLTRAKLSQGKFKEVAEINPSLDGLSLAEQTQLWGLRGDANVALNNLNLADIAYRKALSNDEHSLHANLGLGRLAYARNDTEAARSWLEKLFLIDPDYAGAWSLLGDIETSLGRGKEAEAAYGRAIAGSTNNAQDLLKRGFSRIYLEDFKGAAQDIEKVRERMPYSTAVAYADGLLNFYQDQYQEANADFEKALSYKPDSLPALFYSGLTHFMLGHAEQAHQSLARFVNEVPSYIPSRVVLALIQFRSGGFEEAENLLRPVVSAQPNNLLALDLLTNALFEQGKMADGIGFLKKKAALTPDSAESQTQLAVGLFMQGDNDAGLQYLESAIELDVQYERAELLMYAHHIAHGDYEKALEIATNYREKYPDNPTAYNIVGLAYLGRGLETKAHQAFSEALDIEPGNAGAALNLAKMALDMGDVGEASRYYLTILSREAGNLEALLQFASLQASSGNILEAENLLKRAAKEFPDSLRPKLMLARLFLEGNQFAKAQEMLDRIPKIYKGSAAWLTVSGGVQLAQGEGRSAVESFTELTRIQPGSAQAYYLLSIAHAQVGNGQQVMAALAQVLELDAGHIAAKIALTKALALQNKYEEAFVYLGELERTEPKNPSVLALTGWLSLRQNQAEQAVRSYVMALAAHKNSDWTAQLAKAHWLNGDRAAALSVLEQWLEEYPDDRRVQYMLADSYLQNNDKFQAKTAYERVLEKSPNHVIALNNMAMLSADEDPVAALQYAKKALELAPNSAPVMDTAGMLLFKQGDTAKGIRLLEKAAQRAPQMLSIRFHLAELLVQKGEKEQARLTLEHLLAEDRPFANQQEAESLLESLVSN